MLQVVLNIVPVPADPVRWLAILSGYPLGKYFGSVVGTIRSIWYHGGYVGVAWIEPQADCDDSRGLFVVAIGSFVAHRLMMRMGNRRNRRWRNSDIKRVL